jgi:hypothetical protein
MKNNKSALILFVVSSVILIISTVNSVIFIKKKYDDKVYFAELAIDNSNIKLYRKNTLFFEKPHTRKERVLGFIRPGDCSTCYEALISGLNSLKLNRKNIDCSLVILPSEDKDSKKFKEHLTYKYNMKFDIYVDTTISENNFLYYMKTPYVTEWKESDALLSLQQVTLVSINEFYDYVDKLK